jgi:hypothetical protein
VSPLERHPQRLALGFGEFEIDAQTARRPGAVDVLDVEVDPPLGTRPVEGGVDVVDVVSYGLL